MVDSSPSDTSPPSEHPAQPLPHPQKRTRVLLSCAPCRASKLKCDRAQPCSQCARKGRDDLCTYAPRPAARKKPAAKGMSSRLKRLESMVRNMMDSEEAAGKLREHQEEPPVGGHVVRGERGTTYVGATHCMAMLEDIEDLKTYFDDEEDEGEGVSPTDELDGSDILLWSRGGPGNRDELQAQLPERHVADRLITRYFSSMSPSQHIIHRPTFTRTYARFWQDPNSVSFHWMAQLFMMLALGLFFDNFAAPHEAEADSPLPVHDRIRHLRSCAGRALIWGKYMQPSAATLPAFLLYVEAHFLFNRAAQMNCYVLSAVCLRLMFKMGLHRDSSKLASISPFEGEMRRRMWNMAVQVELLVTFHMGLPSMLQGIETDTAVPRNLQDEDFDETSTFLPPGRPETDHTHMTYPIHKTRILRVFGKIAVQAHALTPPTYAEVLKLDNLLQETWKSLPSFMAVRPLDQCIGDPTSLIIQRFGLAAIYNKCRCVLHRRYLAEPVPTREHEYSRKQCLDGALNLLNCQNTIWKACRPGNVLSQHGWYVSSLAVHDFLLAAVVVYLVIQDEHYSDAEGGCNWMNKKGGMPTKDELKDMIKRSHAIWSDIATEKEELRKTADTLATILAKLGEPVAPSTGLSRMEMNPSTASSGYEASMSWPSTAPKSSTGASSNESDPLSSLGPGGSSTGLTPFSLDQPASVYSNMNVAGLGGTGESSSNTLDFDVSWMSVDTMDWRYVDISLADSLAADTAAGSAQNWMERLPLDDMDILGPAAWNQSSRDDDNTGHQSW